MSRRRLIQSAVVLAAGAISVGCEDPDGSGGSGGAGRAVIAVDAGNVTSKLSPLIPGVNGAKWYHDAYGLWDPEKGAPDPEFVSKVKKSGTSLIRYPGGTSSNLFNWKGAIGPQSERSRQVEGKKGESVDSRYGPDEYMAFIRKVGAEPQIMAPFASSTPDEIAAWVAYMNSPEGTEYGDMRAANGHPEPYGVRYWEIGNELYGEHQRYWMSDDEETAMKQYAFGGKQRQTRQRVGTPSDHSPAASVSSGEPDQSFTVWYPPAVPRSQTVRVGGAEWSEVGDLSSAGEGDRVYTFEPDTGTIRFGDDEHGKIPPKGVKITADYVSGPHAGFVDYYAKMKKVDPSIDVIATWASIGSGKIKGNFPRLMAEHGHGDHYDGMSIHPYTNFSRDLKIKSFPDKRAGHDFQMIGEAAAGKMVSELKDQVSKYGRKDAFVAVSECGALYFSQERDPEAFPQYSFAMSHVLYMASQWARFVDLGVRWTASNDLIVERPGGVGRSLFGGRDEFIPSAEAVMREQLSDFFQGGGRAVKSLVHDNTVVKTRETALGSSYEALLTTATVDKKGRLNVLVVNRSPDQDIEAHVAPGGIKPSGNVDISVVAGESYDAFNDVDDQDAVSIETSQEKTDHGTLTRSFKAHSVTLLRFAAR